MNFSITQGDVAVTSREFIAGLVAIFSLCGSLAFGYGIKVQQVAEIQSIVVRHDSAILQLSQELVLLRIAVAELNGTMSRSQK